MFACVLLKDFEQAFEEVLGILTAFTPKLEATRRGLIYMDVGDESATRATHQFADGIVKTLAQKTGVEARMGMSQIRFVSFVAAHQAQPGECLQIPQDQAEQFLADQSVWLLPIHPEHIRRLQLLGLRTLGQVATVPVSDLVHQFGKEGRLMAELSRGIDPTPLTPHRPSSPLVERYRQTGFWQDVDRETCRPMPVEVKCNDSGDPQAVRTPTGWQPVNAIVAVWKLDDRWWTDLPIHHCCFEVRLRHGIRLTLVQDIESGNWIAECGSGALRRESQSQDRGLHIVD